MVSGDQFSGSVNIKMIQDDAVKLWNAVKSQPEISEEQTGNEPHQGSL
jgi:fatty acid synthase subunit alpha, fungi type